MHLVTSHSPQLPAGASNCLAVPSQQSHWLGLKMRVLSGLAMVMRAFALLVKVKDAYLGAFVCEHPWSNHCAFPLA